MDLSSAFLAQSAKGSYLKALSRSQGFHRVFCKDCAKVGVNMRSF